MRVDLAKEAGETANFSVILPGPCNAACSFCFWKRSQAESPFFAQQLAWYLATLGPRVTQISLTGGEPTLSPLFDAVIETLRPHSDNKIVLTTNGAALAEKLPAMKDVVRHINISRHAVDDAENARVFGTDSVPSKAQLTLLCAAANDCNIDVTINKVIPHDYSNLEELHQFITLARDIGASALALRKDYAVNSLDATPLEKGLGKAGVFRSCPVCVTNSYLVRGLPVHFKMSLEEPSAVIPYIYEFVYHPNGKLTEDWQGEKEIEFVQVAPRVRQQPQPRQQYCGSSGCGQSSYRSGC